MPTDQGKVLETLAEWQFDPRVFVREGMGIDGTNEFRVDPQQDDLFRVVGELALAKLKYKDVCNNRAAKSSLTERDWFYIKKQGISVMSGKGCHAKGTKILMWDGSIKNVEDIKVGDALTGDDGIPRLVLSLSRGHEKFYRISYRDGEHYDVNENHILSLQCGGKKGKDKLGDVEDVTLAEFLAWNKTKQNRFFLYRKGVTHWKSRGITIPPYILGAWLGDGSRNCGGFTSVDPEVIQEFDRYAKGKNLHLRWEDDRHVHITSGSAKGRLLAGRNVHINMLRVIGVYSDKFIPENYLFASEKDRLELLAGLLDTDGWVDARKNGSFQYGFIQKKKSLAEQVQFLARSLGFHCTIKKTFKSWVWKGKTKWGAYYQLNISRGDLTRIPCRVERKKAKTTKAKALRFQFKIEELPDQDFYGFSLTGNGRFLGADFTVLHNTGKGFALAMLIFWFLWLFDRCKSPITGPSFDQINKGLLAECHKWATMKAPKTGEPIAVVGSEFEILNDKIYLRSEGPKSRFFAVRTAPPDANESQQRGVLDGWHEDAMMVVVDEAASIQDGVFTSFNTTLTRPFNFAILMFNPTRNSGFAYETHYGPRAEAWVQLHWDARKSSLVTRAQLEAMERDYGKDGPEYRINVLGLPPVDDPSSLISHAWIQSAVDRWEADNDATWKDYPIIAGFDPAREGKDESAYVVRQGMRVLRVDGIRLTKSDELGDWALQQMAADEVDVMFIDSVGIGGPMMDYMRKTMANPFKLRAADVTKAADNDRYHRTRDEKWWKTRGFFEKDLIQIPPDRILKNELGSIKQAKPTDKGKTRVETKKEMKARGMPSPNRGDALMMTFFANDDAVMAAKRDSSDDYDTDDEPGTSGLSWMGR